MNIKAIRKIQADRQTDRQTTHIQLPCNIKTQKRNVKTRIGRKTMIERRQIQWRNNGVGRVGKVHGDPECRSPRVPGNFLRTAVHAVAEDGSVALSFLNISLTTG